MSEPNYKRLAYTSWQLLLMKASVIAKGRDRFEEPIGVVFGNRIFDASK
jgi:hypothetical protein